MIDWQHIRQRDLNRILATHTLKRNEACIQNKVFLIFFVYQIKFVILLFFYIFWVENIQKWKENILYKFQFQIFSYNNKYFLSSICNWRKFSKPTFFDIFTHFRGQRSRKNTFLQKFYRSNCSYILFVLSKEV